MINKNKQIGAALFTALIFLLILTLVGITALRNSGLSERMSSNAQLSQIAYNAAESSINRYISEFNYQATTAVPADDVAQATRLTYMSSFLPVFQKDRFFEYCLDEKTSVKTGYAFDTAITTMTVGNRQVADCGDDTIDPSLDPADATQAGAVFARNKVTYDTCLKLCPGFSFGQNIGCHIFKMEGEGRVAETTALIDQWVVVKGPCT